MFKNGITFIGLTITTFIFTSQGTSLVQATSCHLKRV